VETGEKKYYNKLPTLAQLKERTSLSPVYVRERGY